MAKSIKDQIKDKFVDLMALVVAMAAFVYTVLQGISQDKIEILNKQPLLEIEFNKSNQQTTKGFLLSNAGFGPAIIDSFRYFKDEQDYKDHKFFTEWVDSNGYSNALYLGNTFKHMYFLEPGFVIKTGKDGEFYLLGTEDTLFFGTQTQRSMSEAIIEIWYKSMSSSDDKTYFLRYCENLTRNNIRDIEAKNKYEAGKGKYTQTQIEEKKIFGKRWYVVKLSDQKEDKTDSLFKILKVDKSFPPTKYEFILDIKGDGKIKTAKMFYNRHPSSFKIVNWNLVMHVSENKEESIKFNIMRNTGNYLHIRAPDSTNYYLISDPNKKISEHSKY